MKKIKKSTIQLSKFFITRLNIERIKGKDKEPSGETINLGFDFDIASHAERKNQFKLEFKVMANPDDGFRGIKLEAQIDGFFYFPEGMNNDEMQYLVALNGSSILYGLLRGQLALITGSFPDGKFMLPAVVMDDVISGIVKRKYEEQQKKVLSKQAVAKPSKKNKKNATNISSKE